MLKYEPIKLYDSLTGREWGWIQLVDDDSNPHGLAIEVRQWNGRWQRFLGICVIGDHLSYAVYPNAERSPHGTSGITATSED